ncbi:hypothetical protein [Arthrobacter sp. ISL-72]|uniref:hypothetical protein n=1 Tax=Arthrobacter sp. ISL-72 TaxID=2819114 RepID=UPI001BE700E2|nr:hypothetical protein [Arthrobacter sp. ISL-72]MBT2595733.1 hypothetical protein [Arthrobacter sp. ISL-72]
MKRTIATLGVVGLGLMGATVAANAAPPGTITICHATGSASNPYLLETISLSALAAHVGDTGDIVPENLGDVMPQGQNLTVANIALLANGCEQPGPVVPVDPDPVDPDPVDPPGPVVDPVDPDPVDPDPVDPAVPDPADPAPADPVDVVVQVDNSVPPAANQPAAVPPAHTTVTPVASTPVAATGAAAPAASNEGYNVQTAVGGSGTGIPAWLAGLTGLFVAAGAWVLVSSGVRSRGANS